ncbi:MAG TPA: hypothetical protein P5065_06895 [Candidatus Ratteibacteria bacterium]|nr:hypothetical protein [Candidatus Ratteibacteria bacterium]HRV03833.1 hypothetical protein [Candidatus Ratteibacteria bacterium]
MKKIVLISGMIFCLVGSFAGAQEKIYKTTEVVDKVGARISQLPDGQVIKNISGSIEFTVKLNQADYNNLNPFVRKLTGKGLSNPVAFKGNFACVLQIPGGKVEKFMLSGKSDYGSIYVYRNLDDFLCLLPDIGVQIEDRISEMKKLSGKDLGSKAMSDVSGLMVSSGLKALFNMGKIWLYDAELSTIENSGKKLVKLVKTDNGKNIEFIIDPSTSLFTEILFKDGKSTISMKFGIPENMEKVALTDYMPKSIILNTVDRENVIKIELGTLTYNTIPDDTFYLKKMKLSEFVSAMAIKLMNP